MHLSPAPAASRRTAGARPASTSPSAGAPPTSSSPPVTSSMRSTTRPPAHLEHLDHGAGRPGLHAEDVAVAEFRRSPSSAAGRAASAPSASRRAAAPPARSARARRPSAISPRSCSTSSSLRPSRNSARVGHRAAVLLGRADRVDARRDAALDVVLEARPAALAGDHLVARPDAEQPVRQRHRPARELGRQERTGVEVAVALDAARHQHARERLARSSAAGTGSSCRRAAGCCSAAIRCLIRLFSSASASTTESVTMTSSRSASREQRVGLAGSSRARPR